MSLSCCLSTVSLSEIYSHIYAQAQCFANPDFVPDSIFAFADANWIINVIVKNIFIFSSPRIVCFSNLKSRSILPFTLSMLVLFLYSLFHFLEFLATFVNIRGSVLNGIRKIRLSAMVYSSHGLL